jgi:tetratricopeptide (TPR) repeat protein
MKKTAIIVILILSIFLVGCTNNVTEGVVLLEAEKYEEAKEMFQKDIEREKRLDEAYHGKGIACFELGEYEEAANAFLKALEHGEKETPSIYGFVGACYMEMGEYEKALDTYEKALSMEKITEELKQEIEFNKIAAYEYLGNWEAAKKQMDKYVKAYPNDDRVEKEADFLETR